MVFVPPRHSPPPCRPVSPQKANGKAYVPSRPNVQPDIHLKATTLAHQGIMLQVTFGMKLALWVDRGISSRKENLDEAYWLGGYFELNIWVG